jgi:putative SOS response-associated peptidase YedK
MVDSISMCGRFTLFNIEGLTEAYEIRGDVPNWAPKYNIAPTQEVPIVYREEDNEVMCARWGLIPSWKKDSESGRWLINARAESLTMKPAFRNAIRRTRCIVPANGFYEWKPEKGKKFPFYIRLRERELFGFAGLYERWIDPAGAEVATFCIITTDSNPIVRMIHERMPAILEREEEAIWLNPKTPPEDYLSLLRPYTPDETVAYRVSAKVNDVRIDEPGLIDPIGEDNPWW